MYSLTFKRPLCSFESSLMQLSADIRYIYEKFTDDGLLLNISRFQLASIEQQIHSGLYVLSPLQVKYIPYLEIIPFIVVTLPDFPDIQYARVPDSSIFTVILPGNKEDGLVISGLSLTLYRLSYGGLPKEGFRLEDRVSGFYSSLKKVEKAERVYKLDLCDSISKIPIGLIFSKVESLVGDGPVYKLIVSLLNLPIYDTYGRDVMQEITSGMPYLV